MFPRRPLFAQIALLAALTAAANCTPVPELEDSVTPDLRAAPYPTLIPLEPALAQNPPEPQKAEALEQQMQARQNRLNARAQRLRTRPVE
ncbi:hypothetical protein [Pseudodonghicola xiamenensis]|uniref:Beta-barrel assembly machine subunit BamF n=1 Tax=Pseudodonghicola xiamenensis TaxID=337702 RepID=A0A8J3MER6_9RHOB|nr:hypothetical protein [Pseudodonghicola xiamenensis]GHG90352.1 hypothetical protein GCM10010961_20560 [Pseudodonghicola xiamenensis]